MRTSADTHSKAGCGGATALQTASEIPCATLKRSSHVPSAFTVHSRPARLKKSLFPPATKAGRRFPVVASPTRHRRRFDPNRTRHPSPHRSAGAGSTRRCDDVHTPKNGRPGPAGEVGELLKRGKGNPATGGRPRDVADDVAETADCLPQRAVRCVDANHTPSNARARVAPSGDHSHYRVRSRAHRRFDAGSAPGNAEGTPARARTSRRGQSFLVNPFGLPHFRARGFPRWSSFPAPGAEW